MNHLFNTLRIPFTSLLLLGLLATSQQALADCGATAYSTMEMALCAQQDLRRSNESLQTIFGGMQRFLDQTAKKKLLEAETSWLQYRDTQCAFDVDGETDPDMKELLYTNCKIRLTEDRSNQLYALYETKRKKSVIAHPEANHPMTQSSGPQSPKVLNPK